MVKARWNVYEGWKFRRYLGVTEIFRVLKARYHYGNGV